MRKSAMMTAVLALLGGVAGAPALSQTTGGTAPLPQDVAPQRNSPQTPLPRDAPTGDLSPVQELPPPASPAAISEGDQPFPQSDYLMGDMGGLRTKFDRVGLSVSLGVVNELAYNPKGGTREEVAFANQFSFAARLDTEKAIGLDGGLFTLNISNRNGKNLSAIAELGTLQQVQEIFGRGNVTRISELSYAQDLFGDKLNIKFGRLDIGGDFVAFSCKFQNLTFCYFTPDHIAGDNFFAYPVSQWAARARLKLTEDIAAKVGIYDINTKLASTSGGFSFNTSRSIGSNTMVELAWTPKLGATGLPGTYKAGFWYSSARRNDVFLDVDRQPLLVTGSAPFSRKGYYGYWAQAQQQLTGPHDGSAEGLTLFANFVQTDDRVVAVHQVINAGLFYVGPFTARPNDEIGFAVGRSQVSERLRRGQLVRNAALGLDGPVQRSEYPFEVYYSLNIGKAVVLRPNVQYIHHPGGTTSNKDALVLGLKNVITF